MSAHRSAGRVRHGALALFGALLTAATAARAQGGSAVVRGTVRDSAQRPLPSVLVTLTDSAATPIARTLTDDAGRFRLTAPRGGTLRLRAQRIGFRPSDPLVVVVTPAAPVDTGLVLASLPAMLTSVTVQAASTCGSPQPSDAPLFAAWEQVSAALAISLLTGSAADLATTAVMHRRTVSARGRVFSERLDTVRSTVVTPWRSVSMDTLHTRGYMWVEDGQRVYAAPGLDVLVSPQFVDDHCFALVPSADPGELGLRFTPTPARALLPEVAGTLWLTRADGQLRRAEFVFVDRGGERLQIDRLPEQSAGGSLRFAKLASGAMLIDEWELRMPQVTFVMGGSTAIRQVQRRTMGGTLLEVRRGADTLFRRPPR